MTGCAVKFQRFEIIALEAEKNPPKIIGSQNNIHTFLHLSDPNYLEPGKFGVPCGNPLRYGSRLCGAVKRKR